MTTDRIESFLVRAKKELDNLPDGDTYVLALLSEAIRLLEELKPEEASAVPFGDIVNLYHGLLPMLPKVSKLTDTRKRQLAARWKEDKARQTLTWWSDYFRRASRSDFLTGRKQGVSWMPTIDFFFQPKSMIKLIEGGFGDDSARRGGDLIDGVMAESNARRSSL